MKFHVVTPSYNQVNWLRCCIASVRDQANPGRVEIHHHIQDACSTDGTIDMLRAVAENIEDHSSYSISFISEADGGMYDAINRGWRAASSDTDVVAHLNCDEQYLPGALMNVATAFDQSPRADVLLADIIVVDETGDYVCHRRSLKPHRMFSRFCCAGSTASTFQRVAVTREKNVFFDTSWRNLGDKVWYNMLHRAGIQFAIANIPVAVFAVTGENLNWTNEGLREKKRYEDEYQFGSMMPSQIVSKINACRRIVKEWQLQPPAEYAVYDKGAVERRVHRIDRPRSLWHKKWPAWSPQQQGDESN